MVRLHAGEGAVCNVYSDGDIPEFSNCIASDCMMWVATDNECEPQPESPGGTSTNAAFEPICYPAGYCGLANKP